MLLDASLSVHCISDTGAPKAWIARRRLSDCIRACLVCSVVVLQSYNVSFSHLDISPFILRQW